MKKPIILYLERSENTVWNGSMFHLYDMGCQLRDMGHHVMALINPKDQNVYNARYTSSLPFVSSFSDLGAQENFICMSYKFPPYKLPKTCRSYWKVTTDLEGQKWPTLLTHNMHMLSKMVLLIPSNLENTTDEIPSNIYDAIPDKWLYAWGIYRNIGAVFPFHSNRWLLYSRKDRDLSSEDTIQEARDWAAQNSIEFDEDPGLMNNPYDYYAGLLYTKHIDYSGRLPFEFALRSKPVVPFAWPKTMRKLTGGQTIHLRKKNIIKRIPKLKMSRNLFKCLTENA